MEKHGGNVSQPYSWHITQLLSSEEKLSSLSSSSILSNDGDIRGLLNRLRDLEADRGAAVDVGVTSTTEIESAELARIRATARQLWQRRVGVLVRKADNERSNYDSIEIGDSASR
jgi:hypothetical protein